MKRKSRHKQKSEFAPKASTAVSGGLFAPLSNSSIEEIHAGTLELLSDVGISNAPEIVSETVVANGGRVGSDGRLLFHNALVEKALEDMPKNLILAGRNPKYDLHLNGKRVFVGTGGAAPKVVDFETGAYRSSTLKDLYDTARISDVLENVHFYSRSLVACDMDTPDLLDINTAFASLAGTSKHVMVSAHSPGAVDEIARMCHLIAGGEEKFRDRPFLSVNVNHIVPPMRYSSEACKVLTRAVQHGIPVHINTFSQLGATSPVSIAGCVAQTLAETLAGMVFVWLLDRKAKMIFGVRPMVTDLRTGGMAGGSGEQALLTAVVVQMAASYGLPNSTIAGATDSKISDAQSGFEKCLSICLAAHSGANMITQSCGMHAALMGCAFESYSVDNEMLGAILRTLTPVEVSKMTLSPPMIGETVATAGHFLGHPDTLERMHSDFLYPDIADRSTPEDWMAKGSPDILEKARDKVGTILKEHFPDNLSREVEDEIRSKFDIRLPRKLMGSN